MMAADFLQSNLFSPTAPSERSLAETKWRKIRMNEDRLRRPNNKTNHPQQPPRRGIVSDALRYRLHLNNNNNNQFLKNNNDSRGRATIHVNVPNDNNPDSCRSNNVRSDCVLNNGITPPMLTSILEEGLVRIPEPPKIPRQVRSSNLKSSLYTSRRERVRRCVSHSLPAEANLFAVSQELFPQDSNLQDSSVLSCSRDRSLKQHSTNLNDPVVDLLVVDTSYMAREDEMSGFDENDKSNVSPPEKEGIQRDINFGEPERYGLSQRLPLTKQKEENISKTTDKSFCLNALAADINSDLQSFQTSEKIYASSLSYNKEDLLQIQRDLHKMSLTKDKDIRCSLTKSSLDEINQSSIRETLEGSLNVPPEKEEKGEETHPIVNQSRTPNEVCPSRESAGEYPETYADKDNNVNCKRVFSDQQKILCLLHLLFRFKRNNHSKKEDKILLIEEEIAEMDSRQQNYPVVNNLKKKDRRKQPLTERIPSLLSKWLQDRNKETKLTESSSTTKKKRRLRKKNVYRAGRRIRKRIGYGCQYIGHGLANMTSIIPEASYLSPMGTDLRGYSDPEYIKNDYYDPNAPAWDCRKGSPYIRSPTARY